MRLSDYQFWTRQTAIYNPDKALEYLALGLAEEAGEVAGKLAKKIRDGAWHQEAFEKELGDVFWMLVRLCDELGINSENILDQNYEKLSSRAARGVLSGSGDER